MAVPTKANSVPQVHPTPNQIHRKSAGTKREKYKASSEVSRIVQIVLSKKQRDLLIY